MLKIEIIITEIRPGAVDVVGLASGEDATTAEAGCASDLCTVLCDFLEDLKPAQAGFDEAEGVLH